MYYYTDYNTFKLILTNGTLRFKESTSSNDRLDTIQLYNELITMTEDKLRDANLKAEQKFYFDMLKHNGVKSSRVSLVACFRVCCGMRTQCIEKIVRQNGIMEYV